MNIIDQVILIPTSPDAVWSILSDISQNSRWQVAFEDMSFLNTIQQAEGMRWRYVHDGRTYIAEISAWYNRLGYEYIIVDGAPYAQARGRIRLQEIPEGTLVQWTFQYESTGMLGSLRNIGVKRALTKEVEEGLRNLYSYVMEQAKGGQQYEPKSLMRDAPTYEERSQYQTRYPAESQVDETVPPPQPMTPKPEPSLQAAFLSEPPLDEDDTRPNPVIQSMDSEPLPEPDFVSGIPASETVSPPIVESTPVYEPEVVSPPEPSLSPTVEQVDVDETSVAPQESVTSPRATSENQSVVPGAATSSTVPEKPLAADIEQEPAKPEEPEMVLDSTLSSSLDAASTADIHDTSKISVFDIFGVQKPSETQEMKAVSPEDVAEKSISQKLQTVESQTPTTETSTETKEEIPTDQSVTTSAMVPGVVYNLRRTGFRMAQRQRQIPIRRPEE